jgi:N-ethylmaleimide reductase
VTQSSAVLAEFDLAPLFEPTQLGAISLANRIVMAPMTRSRAGAGDVPTAHMADYYAQRASAGLIVTEGTQPSPTGKGYCRTPGIADGAQQAGWRNVVDRVHEQGGRIVLQLMHCGRVAARVNKADHSEVVAPSAIRASGTIFTDADGPVPMEMPRALARDEIPLVIEEYARAARAAIDLGFDGIELHCASGYLPMQFLSPNANVRTDDYGGSALNRCRFVLELLAAVGAEVGGDRTGFRICPGFTYNDVHDNDPVATYSILLEQASKLELAYLHLVRVSQPSLDSLQLVKGHWSGGLILNNDYDAARAVAAIVAGEADAVSFGRPFIANPDLPKRFARGAPLAAPDFTRLYSPGPQGYSDYAPLED